ncbi:MAG: hypothetical protein CH6_2935 [Candidatus Kapaibacterium sp.]|nr:MAG: hypothetical protein CH6_2935 [Candidatus Kapabacteria bacterium]
MRKFLIIFSILLFPLIDLNAQGCCSISINSLGSTECGTIDKGSFLLGINYWHLNSSAYYQNSKKENDPLKRNAFGNNFLFDIEYGFTKNLSIYLSVPFNFYIRETNLNGISNVYHNYGLGDIILMAKVNPNFQTFGSNASLNIGFGVKFPSGKNDSEQDGIQLPIDLQLGTGSFDFLLWGFFQESLAERLRFTQSLLFKIYTKNPDNYLFGNELNLNSSLYFDIINDFLTANLLVRFQKRWKDKLDNQVVVNSGRLLIEVLPGVQFDLFGVGTRFNFGIPIYTRVEGSQLSLLYRIGLELRYKIN